MLSPKFEKMAKNVLRNSIKSDMSEGLLRCEKKEEIGHFHHLNVRFGTNGAQNLPPFTLSHTPPTSTYNSPSLVRSTSSIFRGTLPLVWTFIMQYCHSLGVTPLLAVSIFQKPVLRPSPQP